MFDFLLQAREVRPRTDTDGRRSSFSVGEGGGTADAFGCASDEDVFAAAVRFCGRVDGGVGVVMDGGGKVDACGGFRACNCTDGFQNVYRLD